MASSRLTDFDYTSWGQVWKVRRYATATDDHLLNSVQYNTAGSVVKMIDAAGHQTQVNYGTPLRRTARRPITGCQTRWLIRQP